MLSATTEVVRRKGSSGAKRTRPRSAMLIRREAAAEPESGGADNTAASPSVQPGDGDGGAGTRAGAAGGAATRTSASGDVSGARNGGMVKVPSSVSVKTLPRSQSHLSAVRAKGRSPGAVRAPSGSATARSQGRPARRSKAGGAAADQPWTGHRRGQGLRQTRPVQQAGGDWMQSQLARMSSRVEGVDSYRSGGANASPSARRSGRGTPVRAGSSRPRRSRTRPRA